MLKNVNHHLTIPKPSICKSPNICKKFVNFVDLLKEPAFDFIESLFFYFWFYLTDSNIYHFLPLLALGLFSSSFSTSYVRLSFWFEIFLLFKCRHLKLQYFLDTAFATSHSFLYFVFSFFVSKYFLPLQFLLSSISYLRVCCLILRCLNCPLCLCYLFVI